jgi:DNA polymerase-3 subunit alpha
MINLNVHSSYEFLNSNIKIDPLLNLLKEDGQAAVAVTDLNHMHGIYQLLSKAPAYGIKPLAGMEILVDDGLGGIPFILYAKNDVGYRSLIRISAMLSYKSITKTPKDFFMKNVQGCVCIAKSGAGTALLDELPADPDDKYAAHDIEETQHKRAFIHTSRYMRKEDRKALKVLNAIRDNDRLEPYQLTDITGGEYILKKEDVAEEVRPFLEANKEIVGKCNVPVPKVGTTLPHFPHPDNEDSDAFLWRQLDRRLKEKTDGSAAYAERLKYEFDVITSMGYSDYFLIVSDAVNYAKSNDIYVGPGRGSSSASLVSFLLNITEVDPLKYNLLFERFLNPERVTMPDIDIDFEDTNRDKIVGYLIDKYGRMNVSNIITYGTLSAKMAARDVGRVLNFSDEELKYIAGIIGPELNVTLDKAFNSDTFKRLMSGDDKYKLYKEICLSVEGLPRHASTHAAGVLVSETKLTENIPIMFTEGHTISQWPMNEVEGAGLLKIDVLGLRNLSLIRRMVNMIRYRGGSINIHELEEDPRVYKMLGYGLGLGVFQLESAGIRNVLREIRPTEFMDLAAVLALYRPGPMKEIPNFVSGKHEPETVTYPHEELEDILRETNGVIVYQEQIMLIASRIAGYTYAQADILRRAMSKKDRETLYREKENFIDGAKNKGYAESLAEHIFNLIMKFADYGFPKSHAVAYSKIAYIMAYIKARFPDIFYSVILMQNIGNHVKINELLEEMKLLKIRVLPPDINRSRYSNTAEEGVRLGLGMIEGVTYKTAESILKAREDGPFKDIYDLKTRADINLSEKVLRNLILSGALDGFEENRKTMLQSMGHLKDINAEEFSTESFLSALGFNVKKEYEYVEEMTQMEKIEGEKAALGFYLSSHPIKLVQRENQSIPFNMFSQQKLYGTYLVFFEEMKVIKTKKGQNMAFAKITDGITDMDAVIFPSVYFTEHPKLEAGVLVVRGKLDERKGQPQMIIEKVEELEAFKKDYLKRVKKIYVRNEDKYDFDHLLGESGITVFSFEENRIVGRIADHSLENLQSIIEPSDLRFMV